MWTARNLMRSSALPRHADGLDRRRAGARAGADVHAGQAAGGRARQGAGGPALHQGQRREDLVGLHGAAGRGQVGPAGRQRHLEPALDQLHRDRRRQRDRRLVARPRSARRVVLQHHHHAAAALVLGLADEEAPPPGRDPPVDVAGVVAGAELAQAVEVAPPVQALASACGRARPAGRRSGDRAPAPARGRPAGARARPRRATCG